MCGTISLCVSSLYSSFLGCVDEYSVACEMLKPAVHDDDQVVIDDEGPPNLTIQATRDAMKTIVKARAQPPR